ncbi:hypothetical protein ACE1MS_02405 [Lysinibacillus sp. fkY74-1]|uniref:Uncharacterized protein n=4 Tax=Lysinibacillus TaxID=400634 RepID=W7RGG3_LYSSH|nr:MULTISPECIES: hypothetical protein [Lysinibacillus]MBE5081995.1 hypothetical protein [Bacillus thuringiensis]ACA38589.1 hypothetical protein Bsph_0977 [Lysinibacillus sphaericus C3-41]EWH30957.1 hypothetical protein P799_21870 [Lysinibacillus sphaericus CBAM5]EWH34965.1 hypothetical protein P799_00650 [Lysinibacillus sphaericus CBAM5]MBI6863331.1 hypothetical protein [Lysinibacillus fusiformis]
MKSAIHYIIVLALVLGAIFLYNKQIGAIPLLLLSVYLFYLGIKKMRNIKNSN